MHLIIGAGGTASWLIPLLKKSLPRGTELEVADGDLLEEKNLDRQLFNPEFVGWNKAEALAFLYDVQYWPFYAQADSELWTGDPYACIWCCADNHPVRKLAIEMVDQGKAAMTIIGGNEYNDMEAYAYLPAWKNTAADPRIYFPELLTETQNDPLAPFACQGAAQEQNRQLALANYLSAGFMVHLYQFITAYSQEVLLANWPLRHFANFAGFATKRYDLQTTP
jgi:hypothetical protein